MCHRELVAEKECYVGEFFDDRFLLNHLRPQCTSHVVGTGVHFVSITFPATEFFDNIGADAASKEFRGCANSKRVRVEMVGVVPQNAQNVFDPPPENTDCKRSAVGVGKQPR